MFKTEISPDRSFGLDVFRVLAISLVFYSHAIKGTVCGLFIGNIGVELFFVLSGFLVARPLFSKPVNYTFSFVWKFMFKRWLRTIPLYYFLITLKIILTHYTFKDSWRFYFFTQTYGSDIFLYAVSWSLSVEEWFYLLLPLVALLVFKTSQNKGRILFSLLLIIVVEIIWRFTSVVNNQTSWQILSGSVHLRLDSLVIGVLLAFLKYGHIGVYNFLKRKELFLISLLFLFAYLFLFRLINQNNWLNTTLFMRIFGFTTFSLICSMVLPHVESSRILELFSKNNVLKKVFLWGSTLTYSFYLIHFEVIEVVNRFHTSDCKRFFISLFVSLFLSFSLYQVVERPFLILKNKVKIR